MSIRRRFTASAFLVCITATPGWALTGAERQCQAALASGGRRLLDRSLAILGSCHRAVALGALPPATDCSGAITATARATAAAKLAGQVVTGCSPEIAAAFHAGGDCAGAQSRANLADCVAASHEADAGVLTGVAAPTLLAKEGQRCQDIALRRASAFVTARVRVLQHCKRRPPTDLPPGSECAADARVAQHVADLRSTAARKIAAPCSAAGLAAAGFSVPCAAPTSGGNLADCLLDVATAIGDNALATEYRDTGFCGDAGAAVEQRVDDLLARMTLAEKIAQMHGTGFPIPGLSGRTAPSGVLGIPGIAMLDGPRGVGFGAGNATAFPVGSARGATWDPALEARVGEAIGTEARAKGADMILAPTLNILRHPRWGRAQETYGEDTFHLGRMAVGFVRGAQQHVIANPKHYAGNSIENTRFGVDVSIDERTLREVYLPHFRMTVQDGHAGSVMSSYNKVNGSYASESTHLLHDVLKGDWGFQGFVESDWVLAVHTTVPSLMAGLDIEMPVAIHYGQQLADAVGAGQVPEALVDAAVRRILRAQLCFRLDTDPPVPDPAAVETAATKALAREVAREGIVLLKNAGGALPLDRGRVGSIVVVGALATMANLGDVGSSTVVPSSSVTPLDGIVAAAGAVTVTHVPGPTLSAGDQAVIAAADAAVVIAGLTFEDEGEGLLTPGDRQALGLPRDQDALVTAVSALNPRTVVVLEGSGAITMPWVDQIPAILMAWYPGDQGGRAIADVLFGDVNPSGKLPVTFPQVEADLPPFDNTSLAVTYGYFHGYRYLDRNGVAPLFPFGFGLSYTRFAYANLKVSPTTTSRWGRIRVTADVTNTGAIAGNEVAQLYVGYPTSLVDRAIRDLKAFVRVHLEAGETKAVQFNLRVADVAYWDSAAGAFMVEPTAYTVEVGSSSRDLPLSGSFSVAP